MTATYVQKYDSIDEMVAAADAAYQAGRSHEGFDRAGFIGRRFSGWEDVAAQVGDLWPEGLDLVQEMLFELRNVTGNSRPKSRVRRARWSADGGDELDMDRLRGGQDYWRQTVREEHDAPQTLALIFSFTTPSRRAAAEVLWRGAVAIVLADLLESLGFRVELWAVNNCSNAYRNGNGVFQAVCLKQSSSPVDIASLVNGISVWFYRTVVFQSYYTEASSKVISSLGHCLSIDENTPLVKELAGNAKIVVVDGIWDRSAAEELVRKVMAQLS